MKKYDVYKASKSLAKMNLNLGELLSGIHSYWCRVVISEKEMQNPKLHAHSFFELHLCLEGSGNFIVAGKEIVLGKNEYILLPPHTEHQIVHEEDGFRKFVWGFTVKEEATKAYLMKGCLENYKNTASDEIIRAIDIIMENAFFGFFGYYEVICGQLSYIYASLVRGCTDISELQGFRKKLFLVIEEIRTYISDNLSRSPSTEEVAIQFSKSPRELDKMCLDECGMTVAAMKKQLQLEKMRQLLSETDLTLDKIADICGFADRYTMGKFFKKLDGQPPGEFRRSSRK